MKINKLKAWQYVVVSVFVMGLVWIGLTWNSSINWRQGYATGAATTLLAFVIGPFLEAGIAIFYTAWRKTYGKGSGDQASPEDHEGS